MVINLCEIVNFLLAVADKIII